MGGLPPDLVADLTALADGPLRRPLPDDTFDGLARRVFEHQVSTNPTYRRFCEGRGVDAEGWPGWERVPAVPTRGFKDLDLISGDPDAVERVFRTSGTSAGRGRRGTHHVQSVDLYRRLSVPWFGVNLLPDVETPDRLRIISLVPGVDEVPDSSLSTMIGFVIEAFGDDASKSVAHPERGLDEGALRKSLRSAEEAGAPVLVVGTAFAFVHAVDLLAEAGTTVRLPAGSRVMETGGFKGRSREVPRDTLYDEISRSIGVPGERIVNEYGMTELLSQFYEPILENPAGRRRHVAPPWMRTRILDPETLRPVPSGETGLLQHFDLANVGSVSAVLTDDLGRSVDDGFVVLGRSPGAEPRGCSLAMEELLDPDVAMREAE